MLLCESGLMTAKIVFLPVLLTCFYYESRAGFAKIKPISHEVNSAYAYDACDLQKLKLCWHFWVVIVKFAIIQSLECE